MNAGDALCSLDYTGIAEIQGPGSTSPLTGAALRVSGVVTFLAGNGVYIQDPAPDGQPGTSEGLFLDSPALFRAASRGDLLVTEGTVSELGEGDSLTALADITAWSVCASHQAVETTGLTLPLGPESAESLEAMAVHLAEPLYVTDTYEYAQGRVRLSGDGPLLAPTELARPGQAARELAMRNQANSIPAIVGGAIGDMPRVGTGILSGSAVLGHDGRGRALLLNHNLNTMNPRQFRIDGPPAGHFRVLSFNLLNYFNGDGTGGGFPTPRGAESADAFQRQRARHRATFEQIQPHIVAVMELENDGFDENSAAADLALDLYAATGHQWLVVNPLDGPIGTDQITVGIFYRADLLDAIGTARVLASAEFQRRSRQPVAQVFREKTSGERFLLVVNHLKSKGSCPESGPDRDLADGQGCWNRARTAAARDMAQWSLGLADELANGRALVVGDMNAYRMEDPITALLDAGLKDLTAPGGPEPSFTHVYFGQAGTLDYAFATTALRPYVRSARVLNINSPWPRDVQDLPLPWLRSSDHDPVVVDLRFSSD